jgi:hypothetical protein
MYEEEPTRDVLDDIEDLLAIRAWSPRFWDADAGEQTTVDPWEHPSWDVTDALTQGWDDPADAADVLDQVVIEDARLTPLSDTPTARPAVHPLALMPVDVDGYWPAHDGDYGEEVSAWAA